jgi:hypothetical protein
MLYKPKAHQPMDAAASGKRHNRCDVISVRVSPCAG